MQENTFVGLDHEAEYLIELCKYTRSRLKRASSSELAAAHHVALENLSGESCGHTYHMQFGASEFPSVEAVLVEWFYYSNEYWGQQLNGLLGSYFGTGLCTDIWGDRSRVRHV